MAVITAIVLNWRPRVVNEGVFGKLQIVSAAWMGLSHGTNDAQKTMGIIALALFTGTTSGAFDHLPGWLGFLHTPEFKIGVWVKIVCALTMAGGTAAGGWRIIRTMGHKMVRLQPVHGFAAETTAGAIIFTASHFGIPALHDPRDRHLDHGRRRDEAVQRGKVGPRPPHRLGVGAHDSGDRAARLPLCPALQAGGVGELAPPLRRFSAGVPSSTAYSRATLFTTSPG
ncbi:MAG: inorganic phosphate transporter [Chthoniobacter sp.]